LPHADWPVAKANGPPATVAVVRRHSTGLRRLAGRRNCDRFISAHSPAENLTKRLLTTASRGTLGYCPLVGQASLCDGIVFLHCYAKGACHMATATQTARSGQSDGDQRKRPERVFRVGYCWATIWCNELRQELGPNEQNTRYMRSVHLERRFWNEKLNDGDGDYDSSHSFGLGDIHCALAVLQLAADYIKQAEADVTRQ
jgi:hypothetical protein